MEPYFLWAIETLLLDWADPAAATAAPGFTEALSLQSTPSSSQQGAVDPASSTVTQSIQDASQSTGLSANLLKAVATVESGLNPTAVSSAGAIGVMQLMPGTAAELGVNPTNVTQNVKGGAEYLKSLLGTFHGDVSLALAAYNAGPGAVEQFGGIPPFAQTQQYVKKVLAVYQQLNQPPV